MPMIFTWIRWYSWKPC